MCGVSLRERQPSTELRRRDNWGYHNKIQTGHGERKYNADCARLVVEGTTPAGRPKNSVSADACLLKVDPHDVHVRNKWRAVGRACIHLPR